MGTGKTRELLLQSRTSNNVEAVLPLLLLLLLIPACGWPQTVFLMTFLSNIRWTVPTTTCSMMMRVHGEHGDVMVPGPRLIMTGSSTKMVEDLRRKTVLLTKEKTGPVLMMIAATTWVLI